MSNRFQKCLLVAAIAALSFIQRSNIIAQESKLTNIKCGDIVDAELTPAQKGLGFRLQVQAGTTLIGNVAPLGTTFNPYIVFLDSGGQDIIRQNIGKEGEPEEFGDLIIGSSNSELWIYGVGVGYEQERITGGYYGLDRSGTLRDKIPENTKAIGYVGAFTISLGCKLRDGTIINAGDNVQPTPVGGGGNSGGLPILPPAFGFPGLAPVDFSSAIELPFVDGQPIVTAVAGNVSIISKLTATAGEVYTVNVVRSSGTASLGLTVLDPTNVAVFTVAMGSMDSFTANIKISADGIYTLGFYNAPLAAGGENTAGAYTITVTKQ